MADITALQNIVNNDTLQVSLAQQSVNTAQSSLESAQAALASFQAKLDAANALAASLPAGSPEQQAAEDKAANYQITVNNYVNNTIPNAQATLQNNTTRLTSATTTLNNDQQALDQAQSAANSSNTSSSTSTTNTNSPTPVTNSSSSSSPPTSSGNPPANTNSNIISSDDSTTGISPTGSSDSSSNGTVTSNNSTSSNKLNPARENPLSNFSSYTYNISLYMISPDSFNTYSSGGSIDTTNWELICRSGGINNSQTRADGFTLDYYIDNLQITTQVTSKITGSPNNSFKFHFQVFEPYGFKFPTQLVKAATTLQQTSTINRSTDISETIVALQTQFLIAVRFYGYDAKGELIDPSNYTEADTTTEKDAVFERSWPIQISSFKFKLDNKMIVYDITAVTVNEQVANSKIGGTTGETFQIKGQTVKDMLIGNTSGETKSNITGLIEYLNDRQLKLQKNKQLEQPDTYQITFAPNSGIDTAVMVELSDTNPENTPNKAVTSSSDVNVRLAEKAPVVQKLSKPMTVTNELITSVIDRVISQSTFVTNAFNIKDKENKPVLPSDPDYNQNTGAASDTLAWYNVNPVVTLGKFDNLRKKHAVNINYVVQRYEIPYIRGINIGKKSQYPGAYKRYQYYYMGDTQNAKEIIGYEQDYNLVYFNILSQSSDAPITNTDNAAPAATASTEVPGISKDAGYFSKTIGAFKSFLYSPSEQLKAKITILGDPDYLITATNRGLDVAIKKYYGEDGYSINPNTGQIFIEVDFRDAEDYNANGDGLLTPSNDGDIMFWNYPASIASQIQGIAYNVWQVTSTFAHGKFTQELRVSIPPFVDDAATTPASTTNTTASSSQSTDTSGRTTTTSTSSQPALTNIPQLSNAGQTVSTSNPVVTAPSANSGQAVAADDGNTTTQSNPAVIPAGTDPRS